VKYIELWVSFVIEDSTRGFVKTNYSFIDDNNKGLDFLSEVGIARW
jgi:hypothetical protein